MFIQGRITINRKKAAAHIGILLITLSIIAIIFEVSLNSNGNETIRVACVGDSITRRSGYPDNLQSTLGANYTVRNFGFDSTTVLLNTELPYMYQVEFERAKHFLPDVAVVMLGTNDARADHYKSIDNFVDDYLLLIHELQALESKPKIFLVKPPPIFDNVFDLKNVNLVEGIIPRIEQIANQEGLTIIDVYTALENHPECFQEDGVHPNSECATIIANEVYKAIILSMGASRPTSFGHD